MNNQINVGIIRLKKSVFFYLAIASFIVFAFMKGIKMIFIDHQTDSGVDVFLEAISDTSLILVLSMFVSYIIGNEFTNRTIDNEIRIGYSRLSVVVSRAIVVLPFALVPYMMYTITGTLLLGFANGFASSFSSSEIIVRTFLFLVQLMSIQSITLFIMFACKKASLGMMLNIGFSLITCNILRNFFEDGGIFFRYTSFYRIMMNSKILTSQDILLSFVSAVGTLLVMVYISYIVFRRAELK